MGINKSIYLDNNATTPCDPRVVQKMLPYFTEIYGNPANGYHRQGRLAAKAVDAAREQVATLIGAQPYEIVFTGGATESNNLAIFGFARVHKNNPRKRIVTTKIEHKAVLNPCNRLAEEGFDVALLPVNHQGEVCIETVTAEINESTLLVSIQLANNEIGTIQPIQKITEIAHHYGAIVHCDAAQAVGKIPVNVEELGVDLLSMSAHKLYGPKGIGALFVRGGIKTIPLEPILYGGGQEKGIRSGTTNVPAIVGFGEAARISEDVVQSEMEKISKLRDSFEEDLLRKIPWLVINARNASRLPNTSNLTFHGVDADAFLLNMPDIMMSMGSACNSGAVEPSHVLQAIGLTRADASSTIRVSMGRFTTNEDILTVCDEFSKSAFLVNQFNTKTIIEKHTVENG
jgi:cysteine desulfurase